MDAVYTNKNKIAGVNLNDPAVKEQIYERYLKAYKKGAFNYIKEDPTPDGQVVPRKYFSGGITKLEPDHIATNGAISEVKSDGAMLSIVVVLTGAAAITGGVLYKWARSWMVGPNLKALKPQGYVRVDTLKRLGDIGNPQAVPVIENLLIQGDFNDAEFEEAIKVLHRFNIDEGRIRDMLIQSLNSSFPERAIEYFVKNKDTQAVNAIAVLLREGRSVPSAGGALIALNADRELILKSYFSAAAHWKERYSWDKDSPVPFFREPWVLNMITEKLVSPVANVRKEIIDLIQRASFPSEILQDIAKNDRTLKVSARIEDRITRKAYTETLYEDVTVGYEEVIVSGGAQGGIPVQWPITERREAGETFHPDEHTDVLITTFYTPFSEMAGSWDSTGSWAIQNTTSALADNAKYDAAMSSSVLRFIMSFGKPKNIVKARLNNLRDHFFDWEGQKDLEWLIRKNSTESIDAVLEYFSWSRGEWAADMISNKAIQDSLLTIRNPRLLEGLLKLPAITKDFYLLLLRKLGATEQHIANALVEQAARGNTDALVWLEKEGKVPDEQLIRLYLSACGSTTDGKYYWHQINNPVGKYFERQDVINLLAKELNSKDEKSRSELLGLMQRAAVPSYVLERIAASNSSLRLDSRIEDRLVNKAYTETLYEQVQTGTETVTVSSGGTGPMPAEFPVYESRPTGEVIEHPDQRKNVRVNTLFTPFGETIGSWERDAAMLGISPEYVGTRRSIDTKKLKSIVETNRLSDQDIADSRLKGFLNLLNQNGLSNIVVFGGAVRDAILGLPINDIDITVKVDWASTKTRIARGSFKASNLPAIQQANVALEKLASVLGVKKEQFFQLDKLPTYQGLRINYSGPQVIEGKRGQGFVGKFFLDAKSGEMVTDITVPELLLMAVDSTRHFFGHQALQNLINGHTSLKLDQRGGSVIWKTAILRLMEIRHRFGLDLSAEDIALIDKVMKGSPALSQNPQNQIDDGIKRVLNNALNPALAKEELKRIGFNVKDNAMLQTPNKAALVKAKDLGGIDLNQINVLRNGKTVNVQFDSAQLNALTQGGFAGFTFKIESMTRIPSPFQLLGNTAPTKQMMLAKV